MREQELMEMRRRAEYAEEQYNILQRLVDKKVAEVIELKDQVKEFDQIKRMCSELEAENMKLKAKLYDMMVGA